MREKEKRAQEAREEERRSQEAREEEKRAQDVKEQEKKAQEEQEKEVNAQEERREERKVEVQEGHEEAKEVTTQEKCAEAKKETNSMYEESDVSKRQMTWWKNAWWIRVNSGPHMRTARGRRRIRRAARRAAEQACDDDRVEVTRSPAEEAEGETWGRRKGERQTRQCNANTLHVVFHFPTASNETARPASAAAATMRLQ